MAPTGQGSFKLFRFAGIDVFLHWSWFLAVVYLVSFRGSLYGSLTWNIMECLSLFGIVLLHEFGHSLACRQVGGQANQIVLWPLGGVAYVAPPPRPGATLWSIAAGPLVNVVLVPVLTLLYWGSGYLGWASSMRDLHQLIQTVWLMNFVLLIFNILPVFPLDGGQILRCLLWYPFGRGRSLLITTIVGFVGVAGLGLLAFGMKSIWMGLISAFILMNCWRGLQQARALMYAERLPRRSAYACPSCTKAPPAGEFWLCGNCRQPFDTFASQSFCPRCAAQFNLTQCLDCGNSHPFGRWIVAQPIPPRLYSS